jgi:hypothetical protein
MVREVGEEEREFRLKIESVNKGEVVVFLDVFLNGPPLW